MKKLGFLLGLVCSTSLFAAGSVDFLEVNDDVVLFSTSDAKTHSLPSCVGAGNSALWSVSLTTDSGRAIYSVLLTAMAKGSDLGIEIATAGDCAAFNEYERAKRVTLAALSTQGNGDSATTVGLYNFSGEERIGTFLGTWRDGNFDQIYYTTQLGGYRPLSLGRNYYYSPGIYYSDINCQGDAWSYRSGTRLHSPYVNGGRFFKTIGGKTLRLYKSYNNGTCINNDDERELYDIDEDAGVQIHEVCGEGPCVIRED